MSERQNLSKGHKEDDVFNRREFLSLSVQTAGAGALLNSIAGPTAEATDTIEVNDRSSGRSLRLTADTPWIISGKEPEPLQRALADVQRDWYKFFGHTPVVLTEHPTAWNGSVIDFRLLASAFKDQFSEALEGRKSFLLKVHSIDGQAKSVIARGVDLRGAIYAVYAFSEHLLGVDPWWFWADKEPIPRTSIDVAGDFRERIGPPTFKYRGWFIGDEDLLSGFSQDPLQENVYSLDMLDRICEALLRLRGNMIIPATLSFADERCYEFAARRGLILGMDHINVLGLNVPRWPEDVPFSYSKHPEVMERYWQQCIDVLKDKEVVWTVGYRGKGDEPFWAVESGFDTPEARGEHITRAIAKQVELIRKVQPDASIITNLFFEGTHLYQKGLLKIPPGVTLVWSDDGAGLLRDGG